MEGIKNFIKISYSYKFNMTTLLVKHDQFMENQMRCYQKMLESHELSDVTLGCEGSSVKAHKTVLAAASSVLGDIIHQSAHPLPFIYLRGVNSNQLSSMIHFIYYGETTVKEEEFESFTALGRELKIDGLLDEDAESREKEKQEMEALLSHDENRDKGKKMNKISTELVNHDKTNKSQPKVKKIVKPFHNKTDRS